MLGKAAPLVIALALKAPEVRASPECMSKQEARAKWPTKPIYWHGSSRCWNNQPLSSGRSTMPPATASDSATKALAFVSTPLPKATKTEVFFPSIIVNNSVSTDLFIGVPLTDWPLLIDIDGQAPDPNNGADRCCWPSLDGLKALIGAVK